MNGSLTTEVNRLEGLWGGEFGDLYVKRNINAHKGREPFWKEILTNYPIESVLEVGCNIGANLCWISKMIPPEKVFGVDINEKALDLLHETVKKVNPVIAPAMVLPFQDKCFDLVFTTGVLIHQPPEALPGIMGEIARCSGKYVLCSEYFAEKLTEVPYRDQEGALFKQDFGKLYSDLFPELKLVNKGFLPRKNGGWDDLTFWLFEKPFSIQ